MSSASNADVVPKLRGFYDILGALLMPLVPAPPLRNADLDRFFAAATRAYIPAEGEAALDLDPSALPMLRELLRVQESDHPLTCRCHGQLSIEIHRRGEVLCDLRLHHGTHIETSITGRHTGAALVAPEPLLHWLAERGVRQPLEGFERERERARRWKLSEQAWRAATPPGLQSVTLDIPIEAAMSSSHERGVQEAQRLLEAALPDPDDRVLALLRWYGVNGAVNGTADYEIPTMVLVQRLDLASILRAFERGPVDEAVRRGVARHLLPIARLKPATLRDVPDALWTQVRGIVVRSDDAPADGYFDARFVNDFDAVVAVVRAHRGK